MGLLIGLTSIFVVIVFLLVVFIRAARFQPEKEIPSFHENYPLNQEKIISDMAAMIRCKTISSQDENQVDWREFNQFTKLLVECFPGVHKTCTRDSIGKAGILYHWKGKAGDEPTVLMAHYDVVPVEISGWDKPAFDGRIEDDMIWGRGTLDTKGTWYYGSS